MKAIILLRKKEGMSFEDSADRLLDDPVPLMDELPSLERRTVNLAVHGEEAAPYGAVTEFWFEDRERFDRAMASDEGAAALRDAEDFVAAPGPTLMVVDEHNVIDRTEQSISPSRCSCGRVSDAATVPLRARVQRHPCRSPPEVGRRNAVSNVGEDETQGRRRPLEDLGGSTSRPWRA